MSYYYTYVPRFSGEVNKPPEKKEEANPNNPWLVPGPEKKMPPGFNPWLAPAPEKKVELKSHNPWLAPAPAIPAPAPAVASPAPVNWFQFQAVPTQSVTTGQPQPQAQLYYASAPVPEPVKHNFWYGSTKEEVDAQNAAIAKASGATNPVKLIPQNSTPSSQYYCREFDGSYTLRTLTEIMETLQPGNWQFGNPGGYPYWVRTKAS